MGTCRRAPAGPACRSIHRRLHRRRSQPRRGRGSRTGQAAPWIRPQAAGDGDPALSQPLGPHPQHPKRLGQPPTVPWTNPAPGENPLSFPPGPSRWPRAEPALILSPSPAACAARPSPAASQQRNRPFLHEGLLKTRTGPFAPRCLSFPISQILPLPGARLRQAERIWVSWGETGDTTSPSSSGLIPRCRARRRIWPKRHLQHHPGVGPAPAPSIASLCPTRHQREPPSPECHRL